MDFSSICVEHCIGVGTNVAGGAIEKETHLLALQTAKQTGLNMTSGNAIIPW